jgi:sugar phosphate isomerase/epimerase
MGTQDKFTLDSIMTSISRRSLLGALPSAMAVGAAGSPRPRVGCQTNAWPIDPNDFPQFLAVLGKIKELDYQGFETSFRNVQAQFSRPEAARNSIAKTGLRFLGVHIFLESYDPATGIAPWDLLTRVADGGAKLGAERLILSGRAATQDGKLNNDALRRKVAAINRAGNYCREKGMRVAYHNHHLEFAVSGTEIERLLELTDPHQVRLMLDAGHAFYAGADVVAFFRRHHDRMDGMHLRDFRGGKQVPLCQGDFDLRAMAEAIRAVGWAGWLINEEERPNDVRPGDSVVAPARRCIRKVFGL